MTDLLTENARLRAALVPFADESLYVGPEHGFVTVPIAACDAARAALATPAPDAVQEAARVPEIAALIEAANAVIDEYLDVTWGPKIYGMRQLDTALRAIAGDRT